MSNVVRIYSKEGYTAEVEDVDGILFLHCTVHIETLSTFREIKKDIKDLFKWAKEQGHEDLNTLTRNGRFVKFISGSEHVKTLYDGEEKWEVYSWPLV